MKCVLIKNSPPWTISQKKHQFIFTDMSLSCVGNSFNKMGDIGRSGSLLVYIAVTDSDPTARTGNATPSGRTKGSRIGHWSMLF